MEQKFQLGVSAYYLPWHEIREEMEELDRCWIDLCHIDFFDGNFVDNLGLSPMDLSLAKRYTNAKVDVHMMVNRPVRFIPLLADHGADIVYIPPDADPQPAATLMEIRQHGMKAGIAIGPSVSVGTVEALLPLCDYVLVLTVHPGFAGQSYLTYVNDKIFQLIAMQEKYGYQMILDGGMTEEAVRTMKPYGVGMILGTILTRGGRETYHTTLERLRSL